MPTAMFHQDVAEVRMYWTVGPAVCTSLKYARYDAPTGGGGFPPPTTLEAFLEEYALNTSSVTRYGMSHHARYEGILGRVFRPVPSDWVANQTFAGDGHWAEPMLPGAVGLTVRLHIPPTANPTNYGLLTVPGLPYSFRDGASERPSADGTFWGMVIGERFCGAWTYFPVPGATLTNGIWSYRDDVFVPTYPWSVSPILGTYRRRSGLGSKVVLPF